MDILLPEHLLSFFEYHGLEPPHNDYGVWVLGSADFPRVTVVSQQNRALHLVGSLFHTKQARRGQLFGIIGGGIAGATAAMAVQQWGGRVNLFEKEEVLSLFSSATHRWLHPGLFNWPHPGWDATHTDLPFLNWEFQRAADVAVRLREQFTDFQSVQGSGSEGRRDNMVVENATMTFCGYRDGRPQVRDQTGQLFSFDHLIVAVGFGSEPRVAGGRGYWERDDLNERAGRTIIIGAGDGALIDALRVRLRSFDEHAIVREFFAEWDRAERRSIEEEVRAFETVKRRTLSAHTIMEFYSRLNTPSANAWFRDRLRSDTELLLCAMSPAPCTMRSAPLNRFLFSRLAKVDRATWFKPATFHQEADEQRWRLNFEDGTNLTAENLSDHLVVRIGPRPSLRSFSPEIAEYAERNLASKSELDVHRQHFWSNYTPSSPANDEIVATGSQFSDLIDSHRENLLLAVMDDFRRSDLQTRAPHERVFEIMPAEEAARTRIGARPPKPVDRLYTDGTFRQGQLSIELMRALRERKWMVATPAVLVGTSACMSYLRQLNVDIELDFDGIQSIDFLERAKRQREPPDIIAGLDGVAVAALGPWKRMYEPICGALATPMCLFVPDVAKFSRRESGEIIIPEGETNAGVLADEAGLRPEYRTKNWQRLTESPALILSRLNDGVDDAVGAYLYGMHAFVAEQLGLGARVKLALDRANVAPGALLMRTDLAQNVIARDAFIGAFLQSYRQLRSQKEILRHTVFQLLQDPKYRHALAVALGFPLRDY